MEKVQSKELENLVLDLRKQGIIVTIEDAKDELFNVVSSCSDRSGASGGSCAGCSGGSGYRSKTDLFENGIIRSA